MTLALGCIADDYTGATDLANTLTRNGLSVVQVQGVPRADLILPETDAIVVALKSRSIAAERAISLSLSAHDWLRGRGAPHIMFKICSTFDSTDAGNIGPVIDALRARHNGALMPVTPAFPATGRTVYQGHLFVDGVLLSESPLRDHPLNPMRDANLVRVLQRQTKSRVALADYSIVDAGAATLSERLHHASDDGARIAIIDALNERHLETIGIAALDGPLSTGASGLGLGLARALTGSLTERASIIRAAHGKAAMIAGSCSAATLAQIADVEQTLPVLRIDPRDILADAPRTIDSALDWASPHLADSRPFLIATSADRATVERVQTEYGRDASASAIEATLADVAEALIQRDVRKLIVAGGETSGAIVEKLGIRAFSIGAEVAPGVPVVHALGMKEPMSLVLKSGNFGAHTFFADALKALDA